VLLVLATVGLLGPALIAWSSIIQLPGIGVAATASCTTALVLVVLEISCKTGKSMRRLDVVVLVLALILLGAWAATELYFYPAYGTDEAAFVQYSAQLLLHGRNPYTHNLLPALTQFRVPIQYATYKLNGTISSTLGYPALSFLLVVPAVYFTHGVQAIITENVLFLAIEMILVFVLLPKAYRTLGVVIVLGLPFLFDYTIGGDIITMSLPFLIMAAYHWTNTGKGGHLGRSSVLRAICLGLAASVSQFAWFVAPFAIVGIYILRSHDVGRRQARTVVSRFALTAASTFLLLNAPFIVWSPHSWLAGVLSPLDQHAIPFGQGLVDASVFFRLGGGDLSLYTDAALLAFLAALVLFGAFFTRLWRATFVLPSIIFLFSTRSLSEYFIMVVAVWFVAVLSPGDGFPPLETMLAAGDASSPLLRLMPQNRNRQITRALVVSVPAVAMILCISLALTSSPPLRIRLKSVETTGQFRSIWKIRALVTNQSRHDVEPHFATDGSGYMTTFWNAVAGPRTLRPGVTALYTLVAPNVGSMPGVTDPFVLQAVTSTPESISSSALFTPEPFDCTISPGYINDIVPSGKSVLLTVELRSPYGAPVNRAGVRIAMSQVIYSQSALIPGEASIDHAPEGQSPVYMRTNNKGVATFRIRDSSNQDGNPLYFQANVNPRHGFPYGYSEIVSIQWGAKPSA
jgi:hypothetical protein